MNDNRRYDRNDLVELIAIAVACAGVGLIIVGVYLAAGLAATCIIGGFVLGFAGFAMMLGMSK